MSEAWYVTSVGYQTACGLPHPGNVSTRRKTLAFGPIWQFAIDRIELAGESMRKKRGRKPDDKDVE